MTKKKKKWFIPLIIILVLLIGLIIVMLVTLKPMPVALLSEYGFHTLWEEGSMMNECVECHSVEEFHTCDTCHDEHGSTELTNIGFYEVIELTGDVPDPSFVRVNELLPNQEEKGTFITVTGFLSQYGVVSFESVSFITSDGGILTVEAQYLNEEAMLLPYVDGIRFASESLHASTWLKGISRIIVIGENKPLTIDGKATSIGRLLIGETIRLATESTDVMLKNENGDTSHALVGNWIEGAQLLPLLDKTQPDSVVLTDSAGETTELSPEEIANAVLGIIGDEVTLILPDRGRSAWPTDIVDIKSN
jgi:hypothetical protein